MYIINNYLRVAFVDLCQSIDSFRFCSIVRSESFLSKRFALAVRYSIIKIYMCKRFRVIHFRIQNRFRIIFAPRRVRCFQMLGAAKREKAHNSCHGFTAERCGFSVTSPHPRLTSFTPYDVSPPPV